LRQPSGPLPAPLTSLVGREQAVAEISALVQQGRRLITLTGPGGVGKTQLALEVARSLEASQGFADGVFFIELASLADATLVPQVIAVWLGIREQPGQSLRHTVIRELAVCRALIVLDNCEHVVDVAARLVADVLAGGAGVRVLTTSREVLAVPGEVIWRVPPLAAPPADTALSVADLRAYPATRLFLERAALARAADIVSGEHASAVAQICRRLDGLPLAIELAAARVGALGTEELASRLGQRFRVLTAGNRTALPRQQTLRATVEWSVNLLADPERRLFSRLAVFASGFSLEAAETVCGDGVDILDLVPRLVEKSLVQAEQDTTGAMRYRLLETVRQYAQERLVEAGDEHELMHRRLTDWCLGLAERANAGFRGPDARVWLGRLEMEHDNLRAALGWGIAHAPDEAARLAERLIPFWQARFLVTEALRWLRRCLEQLPAPTERRARALWQAGVLANMCADRVSMSRGLAWLEESLRLARLLGDQALVAKVLRDLGHFWFWLGDYRHARALLEEAVALARAAGSQLDLGLSLNFLGWLSYWEGNYESAGDALEESLLALSESSEVWARIWPRIRLARVTLTRGDPAQAQRLIDEGLEAAEGARGPRHLASVSGHLGAVHRWLGELDRAADCFAAGATHAREAGDRLALASNLAGLGSAAALRGDVAEARAVLEECLELCSAMGWPSGRAMALHALGVAAWRAGDLASATAHLRASLALRQQLGEPLGIAECLEGLALVAAYDRPASAARLLGAAEALRKRIGAPLPPVDQPRVAEVVAAAQRMLGQRAFTAAWAAGGALPEQVAADMADRADRGERGDAVNGAAQPAPAAQLVQESGAALPLGGAGGNAQVHRS
jgi:predicted ATPase